MWEMVLQDQEILNALKSGEQEGMEILFDRYYKPLVLFADAYLHDLHNSEDLVQEQFVKLWSKNSFDAIAAGALSTFLFTVVKNACVNLLEKKKLAVESIDLSHFEIAQSEAVCMDDTAAELIREALLKLPVKTRLVVEAVMIRDQMYKDAAEELGVSVNTVKTLLKQGVKELRLILQDKQDLIFLLLFRNGCDKL